jgi:molybdopterin/thiamine biosynthesis adenylyltransferase
MEIESFIKQCSMLDGFLTLADHTYAVQEFAMNYRTVEAVALEMGIIPLRYQRNQSTISPQQQKTLFDSHITIIGCGGLGGHIAEILTRIGIGKLSLYDFDHFEEHNLNRQNFSTLTDLGRDKAIVVKEALERINPSIEIKALVQRFDPLSDIEKIQDSTLVIDALDDPQTKLDLAQQCKAKHIHCVHGAIAGMHGQFSTDNTLEHLYPDGGRGAELSSGNPPFTVTLAASIQASEAIKCILGIGETLQGEFMVADLLYNDFEKFPL